MITVYEARPTSLTSTKSTPSVQRVSISPEIAWGWLENCNTNNRRVNEKHVRRLARDMVEGNWMLTHEGIAFDKHGKLIDGQHRLWAITEANTTVDMYVWRNIDPDVRIAIDCGKSRSMADVLNIAGGNGEVTREQVAILRVMLGGLSSPPHLSASEMSESLNTHREAIDFAMEHLPKIMAAHGVNTAATRGVIARAYYTVDGTLLEDFCRKLTTGIITSSDESVIVLLRQQLQTLGGKTFSQRVQRYGKTERTLVAWLKGENPSRLFAVTAEQFSLPEEVEA